MGAHHLEDILFIRDSRNQMVFLHHRPEGDFYGFQFECKWDGEICYLFCETSKAWFENKHPNENAKQLIELHKEALADRAFEKHTQGDSRLHPSQTSTTLRRYDIALDEEDWAVIENL